MTEKMELMTNKWTPIILYSKRILGFEQLSLCPLCGDHEMSIIITIILLMKTFTFFYLVLVAEGGISSVVSPIVFSVRLVRGGERVGWNVFPVFKSHFYHMSPILYINSE